jgi:hypothetical protein
VLACPGVVPFTGRSLAENVFHEERHGIEGLFLCGGGDVSFKS